MVAASGSRSSRSRRAYGEAQREGSSLAAAAPVKQVASFAVPAGVFFVVTFADSFMEAGGKTYDAKARDAFKN